MWNFPLCCGTVDGKHIVIQQPAKSGSLFYNYKVGHTPPLLLMIMTINCFHFRAQVPWY